MAGTLRDTIERSLKTPSTKRLFSRKNDHSEAVKLVKDSVRIAEQQAGEALLDGEHSDWAMAVKSVASLAQQCSGSSHSDLLSLVGFAEVLEGLNSNLPAEQQVFEASHNLISRMKKLNKTDQGYLLQGGVSALSAAGASFATPVAWQLPQLFSQLSGKDLTGALTTVAGFRKSEVTLKSLSQRAGDVVGWDKEYHAGARDCLLALSRAKALELPQVHTGSSTEQLLALSQAGDPTWRHPALAFARASELTPALALQAFADLFHKIETSEGENEVVREGLLKSLKTVKEQMRSNPEQAHNLALGAALGVADYTRWSDHNDATKQFQKASLALSKQHVLPSDRQNSFSLAWSLVAVGAEMAQFLDNPTPLKKLNSLFEDRESVKPSELQLVLSELCIASDKPKGTSEELSMPQLKLVIGVYSSSQDAIQQVS